jgi:hypothetical protein
MRFSFLTAATLLAPLAAMGGMVSNITTPTSVSNVPGIDDFNSTSLVPTPAGAITTSTILNNAIMNSSFNNANWTFQFAANVGGQIAAGDLSNPQLYFAWAVTDPQVNDYQGNSQGRPITNQDAGGAYFEFKYTPTGTDPQNNVDFLQIFSQSINGGALQYFVDNGGGATTPFYVNSGHVGGSTLSGKNTLSNGAGNPVSDWMLDDSADCENTFNATTGSCNAPTLPNDETLTSASVNFQVFVATDSVTGANHTVTLYRGYSWGYTYTNTDTPEPAAVTLCGMALAGLLAVRRRLA